MPHTHSARTNLPNAMMLYRSIALTAIAALLLVGTGCDSTLTDAGSDDPDEALQPLGVTVHGSDEIELDMIEEGDMRSATYSDLEAEEGAERTIRSQDELETLWDELHGHRTDPPAPPEIDFDSEIVIAIMLGQRPTGGFGIDIDDVLYDPDENQIEVIYTEIEPRDVATTVITSPFLVASVVDAPDLDAEVEFTKDGVRQSDSS